LMNQQNPQEIPVYLFFGFLDSGKTKFIQETLEDERFNAGERTLLLVCEEGEEEYDPSRFAYPNVYLHTLEDPSQINPATLEEICRKYSAERVVVEYNGMWMVQDFLMALPETWAVYQAFMFADAGTFEVFNNNMRSLVYDKLSIAEFVVFNRYSDDIDQMTLHKIVRGVSRGIQIAYEYEDGQVLYDEIEDPLPFDINAPVVKIEDRDYALFYRDLSEEPAKYDGKTVEFTGIVARSDRMKKGSFAVGRHVMTCCVEDIRYAALVANWENTDTLRSRQWVHLTAKIGIRFSRVYGKKGPVLEIQTLEETKEPDEPVATFY